MTETATASSPSPALSASASNTSQRTGLGAPRKPELYDIRVGAITVDERPPAPEPGDPEAA
jgi:hypothetical protein